MNPLESDDTSPLQTGSPAEVRSHPQTVERIRPNGLNLEDFQSIADFAPVGISLCDTQGQLIYVNPHWCEMAGISADEAIGDGWNKSIHQDDLAKILNDWQAGIGHQRTSSFQFRFVRPDRSEIWAEGSAAPVLDTEGRTTGYVGSCVDITSRKNSEEALKIIGSESERNSRLYEGLLSNTPDLAYVFDLDHRFTYVNKALLEMWGRTLEDSIGKTCLELGYEPWHAEMHSREIDQVIATRQPIRGEVPFFHESLGKRTYDYIFTPVLGENGNVEAIAGSTRDVTDRKSAEERGFFLSELTGRLVRLDSHDEIIATTVKSVGEWLGVDHCHLIESQTGLGSVILETWSAQTPKPAQSDDSLNRFKKWSSTTRGTFAVNDVETHPSTNDSAPDFLQLGIRAVAGQSLPIGDGRSMVLAATYDSPHRWTDSELAMLDHVLARVWPLVEKSASEAALRESRLRLRLVSDHVPALISYMDTAGHFQFTNARYTEWFGYSAEELVGKTIDALLDPKSLSQRKPYLEKALSGEAVTFEGPALHRNLGWRSLHISYDPDFGQDGKVRGFYVMALDITERIRSEKLLERRARHSKILCEAAGIILTAEDPESMLQGVFSKIQPLLQLDVYFNFMVGTDGQSLHLASTTGISSETREALATIQFGQGICGSVAVCRTAIVRDSIATAEDPMVNLVKGIGVQSYVCNPLLAGDELLGTLSFASKTRDRFEPDEIEFLQTISHYVTGSYVRLRLLENLRLEDRRKDEFLATLAHELRNPLAPIRTGLEIMKMASEDSKIIGDVRGTMERQVEQLVVLVNDLLDVSRITRGKLELRKSCFDITQIIRSAAETSQPLIDQSSQTLQIRLPDKPVHVEADPHRLSQIISNLLNNASKYSGAKSHILLEVENQDASILIRITDQGVGIPNEMLDRVFEMFTQVGEPSANHHSGLGIGLTLVKSLVELHHGKVWAESAGPGKGSIFQVLLPSAEKPQDSIELISPTDEPNTPARRILVIDDNEDAAETLSIAVQLMGHEVRTAFNGESGVALLSTYQPDIIFLDLGMPGIDGCETAEKIRAIESARDITLIALTGWGQEETRRKTTQAGFDYHVVKPIDLDLIRSILAESHKSNSISPSPAAGNLEAIGSADTEGL